MLSSKVNGIMSPSFLKSSHHWSCPITLSINAKFLILAFKALFTWLNTGSMWSHLTHPSCSEFQAHSCYLSNTHYILSALTVLSAWNSSPKTVKELVPYINQVFAHTASVFSIRSRRAPASNLTAQFLSWNLFLFLAPITLWHSFCSNPHPHFSTPQLNVNAMRTETEECFVYNLVFPVTRSVPGT